MPNTVLEDPRLSIEAKGLLCYLLSRPPNWQTNQGHIQRTLRIGRKLLLRCRGELRDAGYVDWDANQSRDELNRFNSLNYVVRDIPTSSSPEVPGRQRPEPMCRGSSGNNKDQIKTDLNNTLPKPLARNRGGRVSPASGLFRIRAACLTSRKSPCLCWFEVVSGLAEISRCGRDARVCRSHISQRTYPAGCLDAFVIPASANLLQ